MRVPISAVQITRLLALTGILFSPALLSPAADQSNGPRGETVPRSNVIVQVLKQDLTGMEEKEGVVLTVEYPPGWSTPKHRHNAHVFVYVLEGSVVMQNEGGAGVTLNPGQTFYESPNDIHAVAKNASDTKPAKFLVFIVKDKGAPVLVPVQ